MSITIQIPSGERREIQQDSILIGRGANCQVSLPDEPRLRHEHARLRKIAGRWIVESMGDWLIQAGGSAPSRLAWLKVGDIIRLSAEGPELFFEPVLDDVVLESLNPNFTTAPLPSISTPLEAPATRTPPPIPREATTRPGPPPLPARDSGPRRMPPPLPESVSPRATPPPLPSGGAANRTLPPPLPKG